VRENLPSVVRFEPFITLGDLIRLAIKVTLMNERCVKPIPQLIPSCTKDSKYYKDYNYIYGKYLGNPWGSGQEESNNQLSGWLLLLKPVVESNPPKWTGFVGARHVSPVENKRKPA
jgi:hypothetical protein